MGKKESVGKDFSYAAAYFYTQVITSSNVPEAPGVPNPIT